MNKILLIIIKSLLFTPKQAFQSLTFDRASQHRVEEEEIVIRDWLLRAVPSSTALEPLSAATVTRSHRGHMVKTEADTGLRARSSSTSFCSCRFCSFSDPNNLFRYSHSISVCLSLLLYKHLFDHTFKVAYVIYSF